MGAPQSVDYATKKRKHKTLEAAVRATNVFFKKWCPDSVPELDGEEIKERIDEHGEYLYDDND